MKRFDKKGGPPASTRSGPRARAAQDRKYGEARGRGMWGDPYQRAERPPRNDEARSSYSDRLQAPARGGVTLDADVARVFRNSESVNEALRLVIRLARSVTGGGGAYKRSSYSPGQRSGPAGSRPASDRFAREDRSGRRGRNAPLPPRDARFDDSE
jgi:hypothetical protein